METNNNGPEPFFREILPDGTAFDMIFVEGGSFLMGSDEEEAYGSKKPVHQVELPGFYIEK